MSITKNQIAAAMALLGISQSELAENINLSKPTVSNLLKNNSGWESKESTKRKVVNYLLSRGIEFTEGNGVRECSSLITLSGHDGFVDLMKMVLSSATSPDADICVSGVDERLFTKWEGEYLYAYLKEIVKLHKEYSFNFRIIVEENDDYKVASEYAEYRTLPSGYFSSSSVYIFGDKVAFIEFSEDNVLVWVINSKQLSDAQRKQFNLIWERL